MGCDGESRRQVSFAHGPPEEFLIMKGFTKSENDEEDDYLVEELDDVASCLFHEISKRERKIATMQVKMNKLSASCVDAFERLWALQSTNTQACPGVSKAEFFELRGPSVDPASKLQGWLKFVELLPMPENKCPEAGRHQTEDSMSVLGKLLEHGKLLERAAELSSVKDLQCQSTSDKLQAVDSNANMAADGYGTEDPWEMAIGLPASLVQPHARLDAISEMKDTQPLSPVEAPAAQGVQASVALVPVRGNVQALQGTCEPVKQGVVGDAATATRTPRSKFAAPPAVARNKWPFKVSGQTPRMAASPLKVSGQTPRMAASPLKARPETPRPRLGQETEVVRRLSADKVSKETPRLGSQMIKAASAKELVTPVMSWCPPTPPIHCRSSRSLRPITPIQSGWCPQSPVLQCNLSCEQLRGA
eukprot:gnl/TRDRNA2_/TRDRNA2_169600_c0_seq3.p1 gnl/TRDRNA2_/TRDRNA2_169600_c0~~gnl/TRDRNA2_/TRDRNA2_169600_c0_seq3.p1  ORF type:complete len:419 (+),score=65.09 gnl/TRDRNA2_/TRDRNA2_169600_c0_seq3:59-1315(+)